MVDRKGVCATALGELVTENPLRGMVIEKYGLDFCCGGKKTLADACGQKGINIEEVIDEICAADGRSSSLTEPDWSKTSLTELVNHIVCAYHKALKEELPRIVQFAEKVAKVHDEKHPEMVRVRDIVYSFRAELEAHMQKEELILFPTIVSLENDARPVVLGCGGGIANPIQVMMQEHESAGEALAELRSLTNGYSPPEGACTTFKVLLHSLAQLEREMHQHVHKENNILFPRALNLRKGSECAH